MAAKLIALLALLAIAGCAGPDQPLPEDQRCFDISTELTDLEVEAFMEALDMWGPDAPELELTIGESKCENFVRVGLFPGNSKTAPMAAHIDVNWDGQRGWTGIGINPEIRDRAYCTNVRAFAHELGHAFGIYGHDADKKSAMNADGVSCQNETVSPRDLSRLRRLY